MNEDTELVTWLLDHGADPNHQACHEYQEFLVLKSLNGMPIVLTPLETAARSQTREIFQLLLGHGAKVEKSNALHAAGPDRSLSNSDDKPLIPMIGYLLDLGMDINAKEFQNDPEFKRREIRAPGFEDFKYFGDRVFGTPLHYAAKWGALHVVNYLLERGADPSVLDSHGMGTALDWAREAVREAKENERVCEEEEAVVSLLSNL